ncbi:MAG: phytanoyl-CoA dioxygenase family protein [Bacteroidia bacterium]|nr:phytanoyl-CoA dioxygenase family protein [Bacteroidia bacterium]
MPFSILKNLWERSTESGKPSSTHNHSWNKEMETLYAMGIGMEETLRFLFEKQPDFETFQNWINARRLDLKPIDTSTIPDVLSSKDLEFWNTNGYIVIKNAVAIEDCVNTQNAIWHFLNMDADDSNTWYKGHEEKRGLMLTFVNHPTLYKNRQSPKIKKAYEQIYNSTHIFQRIDKVSFNPPEQNGHRFLGDALHWDVSLKQPIAFGLQGLLYLTDCEANAGAFHCVPGFHNNIERWLKTLPPNSNPRGLAPQLLKPVAVPGKAGDFVIWHQALPHCATPNKGIKPRMVQYLTYLPQGYTDEKEWL